MAALLRECALPEATIAPDLDVRASTFRMTLKRHRDRFVRLADGRVGLRRHG